MPYRQGWYIEQRVIVAYMWGTLTLDELQAMWSEGAHMMNSGISPIHIIAFDSDIEQAPRNLQTLRDMSSKIGRHPSVGWVINIGYLNPFTNFVSGVLARIFGVPYRRFGTFDEAVDFLHSSDLTINWEYANTSLLDNHTVQR